jgi:hypothetical protein
MIKVSNFDPWVYDTDGDCYISSSEAMAAQHDWQMGIITVSNANEVINLWLMGTKNPACIAGHLAKAYINDVTTDELYGSGGWPIEIPFEHTVNAGARASTDSPTDITVTITSEFIDPGGNARARQSRTVLLPPGTTAVGETKDIVLNKAGIWELHAILTANGVVLDERTMQVIVTYNPSVTAWSYDRDGDCYISQEEAMYAVNDYNYGEIPRSLRDEVVALWENHIRNPACAAPDFNPWDYDTDGDCYISQEEAMYAVNDYNYGKLSEEQRDEVVALWTNNTRNPECGVPPVCETDTDCPEGYVCRGGKCVKEGAFPWQWLLIGGMAITGVLLLIPKPKKAVKK